MKTPPSPNVGPQSADWARWITDLSMDNARAISSLGGDAANSGRIGNSSMDNMRYQIQELYARQSGIVTRPDVSTPSFSSGTQTITLNMQIPRPKEPRIGWVTVQFTGQNSTSTQSEIYGSFSVDGSIFHRDSRSIPTANLEPASWNGDKAITGYTGFFAGPDFGGNLELVLQAEATVTGARVVTFKDIKATYQYGQRT